MTEPNLYDAIRERQAREGLYWQRQATDAGERQADAAEAANKLAGRAIKRANWALALAAAVAIYNVATHLMP